MKPVFADKDKIVIEFDKEEFRYLFQIAVAVREDYESLDITILNLEKDEIKEFHDGVMDILDHPIYENNFRKDAKK